MHLISKNALNEDEIHVLDLLDEADSSVEEKESQEETDEEMTPPNQQHKPQQSILTLDNIRKKLDFKNLSAPKKNRLSIQDPIWLHSFLSQVVRLLLPELLLYQVTYRN